jgi:uncharacterized protein YaaQ
VVTVTLLDAAKWRAFYGPPAAVPGGSNVARAGTNGRPQAVNAAVAPAARDLPDRTNRRAYTSAPMKLIVAVVHNEDAGVLVDALLEREFRATRLHSSGGFLKQSNATILVGIDESQVEDVMSIIRANCKARTQVVNPMPPIMEPGEFFMPYPLEVEVGGATVFIVPVERFERL